MQPNRTLRVLQMDWLSLQTLVDFKKNKRHPHHSGKSMSILSRSHFYFHHHINFLLCESNGVERKDGECPKTRAMWGADRSSEIRLSSSTTKYIVKSMASGFITITENMQQLKMSLNYSATCSWT